MRDHGSIGLPLGMGSFDGFFGFCVFLAFDFWLAFSFSVFLFSAGREKKGSLAHGILVGN